MNIKDVPNFEPTGFSKQIFLDRYAFTDKESWEEACDRVARQVSQAEKPEKVDKYKTIFREILIKNLFVPGGRIWYNSGRPKPSLLNCFTLLGDLDSKEFWGELLKANFITAANGGGCGQDFSSIRPEGAPISGTRGTCSGPLSLMEAVNGVAKIVRAGGGRRSANMFSLDLDHPDVLKFLDAKLKKGALDMANVSLRSSRTREFIQAVKNGEKWELSWKGKFKKKISARALWKSIVHNSWKSSEPGFLNMELAEEESSITNSVKLLTTNPCGEIVMPPFDSCCLGSVVLPRFVSPNGDLDWPLLGEVVRMGVRFLDNVLSVNNYPLPEMKEVSSNYRRIGLGTTGLADLLTLMGFKYGSEEGNHYLDKLFRFISKQAYAESVFLAVEKGAFPKFDATNHLKSGFVRRMTPKIKSLISDRSIRNCAILTQAPVGTTSILSGNCSSGIEPMFAAAYYRTYWDGDKRKKELCFHPLFTQAMESGDSVDHFIPSSEVSVRGHFEVQKILQKHIDNAISKTIIIPKNYSKDELSEIWLEYLPSIKGTTIYREGSRNFVDDNGVEHEPPLVAIPLKEAVQLFKDNKASKTEAAAVNDCPKGVCDI